MTKLLKIQYLLQSKNYEIQFSEAFSIVPRVCPDFFNFFYFIEFSMTKSFDVLNYSCIVHV